MTQLRSSQVKSPSYSMQATITQTAPVDASIYRSSIGWSNLQNEHYSRTYFLAPGRIRRVQVWVCTTGTVGTTEPGSLVLRLNNTTDYPISSAVIMSATATDAMYSAPINVDITEADFWTVIMTNPTWATNPGQIFANCAVFVS